MSLPRIATCCVLGIGLLTSTAAADDAPAELKRLTGIWVLETTSTEGQLPTKSPFQARLIILDTGGYIFRVPRHMYGGQVVLDPATSPKRADFSLALNSGGPVQKESVNLSVYELSGDQLTIAKGSKERPTAVTPKAGVLVQVFKRLPTGP